MQKNSNTKTKGNFFLLLCFLTSTALAQTFTTPYCESFDTGTTPMGWIGSTAEPWNFTNSVIFPAYGAFGTVDHTGNGGNFAGVDGSNPQNSIGLLTSPTIDLTNLSNPALSFWIYSNNIHNPGDNMTTTIEVSDDGGTTWTNHFSYAADSSDWVQHYVNISMYTDSIQFRFVVDHTSMANQFYYNDILLDDICIDEEPFCFAPKVDFSVVPDCVNGFTVDVIITEMGDATTLDITDGVNILASNIGLGVTNVGPFINGQSVNITVLHDKEASCDVMGLGLEYIGCPLTETITCGSTLLQNHCYIDNDLTTWLYTASNTNAILSLAFSTGNIQNGNDKLIVYDGIDNTAAVLFDGSNGGGLSGLTINSTGQYLFMEINSDANNSCGSNSSCCTASWNWSVQCIGGCDFPTGTASYDCTTNQISLDVMTIGSSTGTFSASIDGSGTSHLITTTGTYPAFDAVLPNQTYSVVLQDGMGCETAIPYVYGGCRTARTNCSALSAYSTDFESVNSLWNEEVVDGGVGINVQLMPIVNSTLPLAGTKSAALGGYGGNNNIVISTGLPYTSTLSKYFQVANGHTLFLHFWVLADACDSTNDVFEIKIDNTIVYSLEGNSNRCGNNKWYEESIDLSLYADGMSHEIAFVLKEYEINNTATRIYIDDILFEDCDCAASFLIPPTVSPGTSAYNRGYIAPNVWDFETNGTITSGQIIKSGETVDYDAGESIELGSFNGNIIGFEVELGATLNVFIDGCNGGSGGDVTPLIGNIEHQ